LENIELSAEESHEYSTQPSIPSKARIQNLRKPTEIPKKKEAKRKQASKE
jgi:hypothetical protein